MALKGSRTEASLREALAGEAQASRRYLYFSRRAEAEGYARIAGLLRDVAECETAHAFGHLEFLEESGDPATGAPLGDTRANLTSAVEGETFESAEMYPTFAATAREEGFAEIAEWFETVARAEQAHAARLARSLDGLGSP